MKTTQLDLHKVKHEDVNREVINFIEDHWDTSEIIDIITGHSNIMKDLVKNVLDEYNIIGYINQTHIRIYP